MNALAVENYQVRAPKETRDGVIDLFSGTWICKEHETTMKVGHECPFCVVDQRGIEAMDDLVF